MSHVYRLRPVTEEPKNDKYYSVTPISRRLYLTRGHAASAKRGTDRADQYVIQKAEIGEWKDDE